MKPTTEAAFETVIENCLLANGYGRVPGEGYDRARAVFPDTALAFIRETQPAEWAKLEALHGHSTGEQVLVDLCKWMDAHGALATLRHGFKCYGRPLRVAYFKAAHELNPELEERYAANRLGITRQLHYSPKSERSLDVTLSLNGIPIVTVELKNPLTGQTVEDARREPARCRPDAVPSSSTKPTVRRAERPPPTSRRSSVARPCGRRRGSGQRTRGVRTWQNCSAAWPSAAVRQT